ncbi:hypothetical protein [Arthrobacter sp. GMC3]|uniref:hypothetical protein n=1 Tax=Arthrobacter sp. GMC3 TaxID=2058894 RepID=UPI000CE5358B|nr:hypothetical protein [Arthrobacter sp. GMC3]
MSNNGYRGENNLVQSIIMFVIFFALFLGGIFAMSFWSLESFAHAFVPGAIGLGLVFLSLVIPLTWIGRSNSAGE